MNDNLDLNRPKVITSKETAELLGLSITTLRRLVSEGRFICPVRLSSRRHGFQIGRVLDWMTDREKPVAT